MLSRENETGNDILSHFPKVVIHIFIELSQFI